MKKLKNEELGRLSVEDYQNTPKKNIVVVLDNVRSANNVGSVFRTSDALLIEKIYLCGITAKPPHKDIHKTALGATESVEWEYCKNTLDTVTMLKENGYTIVSVEQAKDSQMLNDFTPDKKGKYAFILGKEVKGVAQDVVNVSDICLEIPQFGTKHSFNISVCAGIVLWDVFNKVN
jgi:23S rRNA (guanosine2251-2'-O)-methyltransferase